MKHKAKKVRKGEYKYRGCVIKYDTDDRRWRTTLDGLSASYRTKRNCQLWIDHRYLVLDRP